MVVIIVIQYLGLFYLWQYTLYWKSIIAGLGNQGPISVSAMGKRTRLTSLLVQKHFFIVLLVNVMHDSPGHCFDGFKKMMPHCESLASCRTPGICLKLNLHKHHELFFYEGCILQM